MKILKEPLLYFAIIGGLLFAFYQNIDPNARTPGDDEVVVTPGRIEQLAAIFAKTWQRPPTRQELQGLVDDYIMEEIYYREATEAGLDKNDTLIRRRLRQKLEFLTDDLALSQASDEELEAFMEKNPESFREPGKTTFRQVFFNPDKLGTRADDELAAAAALLEEGKEPEGHSTLLPAAMSDATPMQISGSFGKDFSAALDDLKVGEWSEPVRSPYGYHFVRIEKREPGGMPDFESIRPQLQREWEHGKREGFRDEFNRKLLEKYEVSVKWPAKDAPEG